MQTEQDPCEPPGWWGPRHTGPACSGPRAPVTAWMKAAFQSTNLQVSNSEGKGKAWEAGRAHAFVMHAFASIQLEKLVVLPILSVTLISSLFGEVIGCTSPSPPAPHQRSKLAGNFPSKYRKCEPEAEKENWWKLLYIIQNQELNQDGLLKSYQTNQQRSSSLNCWSWSKSLRQCWAGKG